MRARLHVCLGVWLLFASTGDQTALAQEWLEDRRRAEGAGIRLGDLELHPGIGAEVGYDSNVFYDDASPEGSMILRLSPHLFVSTLGPQRMEGERSSPPTVSFTGGLTATYYEFFIDKAKRNLDLKADLDFRLFPERPFNVTLFDNFTRSIRPFTRTDASGESFARDRNIAGIRFEIGTPSRILKTRLSYAFAFDLFESDTFKGYNNVSHQGAADTSWEFLPHTAIVHQLRVKLQNYTREDAGRTGPQTRIDDNVRLDTRVGLNGALTTRVSGSAFIGYAAGFFDRNEEYDGITAIAIMRWKPVETFNWRLRYDRMYDSAFQGNFSRQDRFSTRASLLMGGTLLLSAEAYLSLRSFGIPRRNADLDGDGVADPFAASGSPLERDDVLIGADVSGEYRLADWLALTLEGRMELNQTDYAYEQVDPMGVVPSVVEPAEYNKFELWLGVRAFY